MRKKKQANNVVGSYVHRSLTTCVQLRPCSSRSNPFPSSARFTVNQIQKFYTQRSVLKQFTKCPCLSVYFYTCSSLSEVVATLWISSAFGFLRLVYKKSVTPSFVHTKTTPLLLLFLQPLVPLVLKSVYSKPTLKSSFPKSMATSRLPRPPASHATPTSKVVLPQLTR